MNGILIAAALAAASSTAAPTRWKLLYEEDFSEKLSGESVPWARDAMDEKSPWYAGPLDDGGTFFYIMGGKEFERQLKSFDTYRKRFSFGRDGWLTAELSARGRPGKGSPDDPPTFSTASIGGRTAAVLDEPDHRGGILIRSTRPLPPRYRIECTLVSLDFGGSRYDRWEYGGRVNGYSAKGAKTRHPWSWGPGDETAKPADQWLDVRFANGFYFLTIVDYKDPAPRNNVFIHTHRKVGIDTYNVGPKQAVFETCNPAKKEYYISQDSTVNMLFFTPGRDVESAAIAENECGGGVGGEGGRAPGIAAAQMVPELMPEHPYTFAIERDGSAYTLEARGFFRFTGERILRYRREFAQGGRPIWHFNQTPEEYDGRFDKPWTYEGPNGKYTVEHSWPKGSAYPDYFILGDPHANYYEGTAAVTGLKLSVPETP